LEAKIVGEVKYDQHRDQTLRLHHRRAWVSRTPFLLLNPNTGKTIVQGSEPFSFKPKRNSWVNPENRSFNATVLLFEKNTFHLPQNLFYTGTGSLLFYNPYQATSYADGTKELSYKQFNDYLLK
jgi:hypothetical protein